MKRWEILLWLVLAFVLVGSAYWLLRKNYADSKDTNPVIEETINPYARLSASGSPLPAPAREDVIVEQQQFDGKIFTLSYDAETGNWQLDFFETGQQSLRYLEDEEMFLIFNPFDLIWDEVDPELLHDDFKALIEIDEILLSDQQLDNFNRRAIEEESAVCEQNEADICAVWQAKSFLDYQEVVIYVNKRTRKIDHIVSLNPVNPTQTPLFATYSYQPVEIKLPPAGEARYLADD